MSGQSRYWDLHLWNSLMDFILVPKTIRKKSTGSECMVYLPTLRSLSGLRLWFPCRYILHSLKRTAKAPENRPFASKTKRVRTCCSFQGRVYIPYINGALSRNPSLDPEKTTSKEKGFTRSKVSDFLRELVMNLIPNTQFFFGGGAVRREEGDLGQNGSTWKTNI